MKTTLKVLATIAKVITILFAVIGAIMSIFTIIIGSVYVDHVYDVVEECDPLAPDDEDQDAQLTAEVFRRTMADPRVKNSGFINAVSYWLNKIDSFVANL